MVGCKVPKCPCRVKEALSFCLVIVSFFFSVLLFFVRVRVITTHSYRGSRFETLFHDNAREHALRFLFKLPRTLAVFDALRIPSRGNEFHPPSSLSMVVLASKGEVRLPPGYLSLFKLRYL